MTDAPTQAEVKAKVMDGDACDVREKVLETFNHGFTSNWIGKNFDTEGIRSVCACVVFFQSKLSNFKITNVSRV